MEKLKSGMLLYHGSYTEIKNVDLEKCISGKDFGKGFYLTSSYEQARNFVRLSLKRNKAIGKIDLNQDYGYINVYELTNIQDINDYYFEHVNIEWLHFVAGNRDQSLFINEVNELQQYNVVVGKIANDRTAATLQAYMDGVNGDPGNQQVDKNTIDALLPNRLEDQYCFKTDDALHALKFIRSEQVTING